jgi:hypothetical protein
VLTDIQTALYIWDQIARASHLDYAVGSAGARLAGDDFELPAIEIYVRPSALANGSLILSTIQQFYSSRLTWAEGNKRIIVTNPAERKGVCVAFTCLGSPGCFTDFIPPYQSPLRNINQHGNRAPTFREVCLFDRTIPVASASLIIKHRLWFFNPSSAGQERHNERALIEIPALLNQAINDGDLPFNMNDRQMLLPRVRAWRQFADEWFIYTSLSEVNKWRRLGIPMDATDVSPWLQYVH